MVSYNCKTPPYRPLVTPCPCLPSFHLLASPPRCSSPPRSPHFPGRSGDDFSLVAQSLEQSCPQSFLCPSTLGCLSNNKNIRVLYLQVILAPSGINMMKASNIQSVYSTAVTAEILLFTHL